MQSRQSLKVGFVLTHSVDDYFVPWEKFLEFPHNLSGYCLSLERLGHKCVLYVPSPSAKKVGVYLHKNGHIVKRIPVNGLVFRGPLFRRSRFDTIGFTFNLFREVLKDRVDLVYYAMYYSSYFVPSFLVGLTKPVVTQYVGGELPRSGMSFRGAIWNVSLRLALVLARRVMVPPYAYRRNELFILERVLRVPRNKLAPFQLLCVDTRLFHEIDQSKARIEVGFDPQPTNILTVTRIPPPHDNPIEKNPFKIVEMLAQVARDSPTNFMLYVVGFGPGERALRDLIAELGLSRNVKILGFVNHDSLPKYYSACDLVFIPYQFLELNDGNAVFESFACGRPVCGFRRSPKVPIEQPGGFLVDSDIIIGSVQLSARLGDLEYLRKKGREGNAIAREYSIDEIGARLQTICTEVLKED